MLDLIPGVSRNTWREHDQSAAVADAEYRAKRPGVLARLKHTCQFCGVTTVHAMEVHHVDCNHANNIEANLMPGCVLCHPVHHLGEASARFTRIDQSEVAGGMVRLSLLPDISQADLSHLLRTIGHVLNVGTDAQKEEAAALYEQLTGYSGYIEKAWGSSRASHFAVALRACADATYAARETTMQGIRVVFSLDAVKKLASRFAPDFAALPIKTWSKIYDQRRPQSS